MSDDDKQAADRDRQRKQGLYCRKCDFPVVEPLCQHSYDLLHSAAFGKTLSENCPGEKCGGGGRCGPGGGIGAVLLYRDGLPHELPLRQGGKADPAGENLPETVKPGGILPGTGLHLGDCPGGCGGRRSAGNLLRGLPASVLLQHAGAADTFCRLKLCESAGGGGAFALRASDSCGYRGGADLCQETFVQILGAVYYPGRHLPGESPGTDHSENLPGGRLQKSGDEPGGGRVPKDHHEGADYAAEFRDHHGSDRLRRSGPGHDFGSDPVPGPAGGPGGLPGHHPSVGGFLHSHAAAGKLLSHCHERHGGQR